MHLSRCNMSGLADTISVFILTPHTIRHVKEKSSHYIPYTPRKFQQSENQWWHTHSILDVNPKEKNKGGKGSHTRWPTDRPGPCQSMETCKLSTPSLPCGNVEAFHIVGTACHCDPVLQNRH